MSDASIAESRSKTINARAAALKDLKGETMGKIMVIVKIKAEDMEKLDETVEQIKTIKSGEVKDIKREPIGFGVEVIKAGILIPEKQEGALEALTKELNELSLVEEAEVEGMTLL